MAPGSVMACPHPTDGQADRFRAALAEELGPDGWLEAGLPPRDIWYVTLLHFAADIPHPERLVCWVDQRRELDLGPVTLDRVVLVRFVHVEEPTLGMRPTVLADALLAGPAPLAWSVPGEHTAQRPPSSDTTNRTDVLTARGQRPTDVRRSPHASSAGPVDG